jgi:hypothetical protein
MANRSEYRKVGSQFWHGFAYPRTFIFLLAHESYLCPHASCIYPLWRAACDPTTHVLVLLYGMQHIQLILCLNTSDTVNTKHRGACVPVADKQSLQHNLMDRLSLLFSPRMRLHPEVSHVWLIYTDSAVSERQNPVNTE